MSFNYPLVPKLIPYEDIIAEVTSFNKLFALYERMCTSVNEWKSDLEQNTSQLEILNETANVLRRRQTLIADLASLDQKNHQTLCYLHHELVLLRRQISIWVKELAAVDDDRRALRFKHVGKLDHLKRSITNIELAHNDFDQLDNSHGRNWSSFLTSSTIRLCPILVSGPDGDIVET